MHSINYRLTNPRFGLNRSQVKSRAQQQIAPQRLQRSNLKVQAKQVRRPRQRIKYGPGRKWDRVEVNPKTGIWKRKQLHVQTSDLVQVIAGKDKEKVGRVFKVDPKYERIWVVGVNVRGRYMRDPESGEMRLEPREFPIHFSNVMHFSEKYQIRSRIGTGYAADGTKYRFLKKTNEAIMPRIRMAPGVLEDKLNYDIIGKQNELKKNLKNVIDGDLVNISIDKLSQWDDESDDDNLLIETKPKDQQYPELEKRRQQQRAERKKDIEQQLRGAGISVTQSTQ